MRNFVSAGCGQEILTSSPSITNMNDAALLVLEGGKLGNLAQRYAPEPLLLAAIGVAGFPISRMLNCLAIGLRSSRMMRMFSGDEC
jgi:hypothetical protein